MRTHNFGQARFSPAAEHRRRATARLALAVCAATLALTVAAHAQSASNSDDPFGPVVVQPDDDPFETELSDTPIDAAAYVPKNKRSSAKPAQFQAPAVPPQQPATLVSDQPSAIPQAPAVPQSPAIAAPEQPPGVLPVPPNAQPAKNPCAAVRFRPMSELGIGIAQPQGQSPTDFATPCWDEINSGPNAACRPWSVLCYQWSPTCLCYRPLYFEDINAERYGYICNDCCCCIGPQDCVQSAASAAHFFATVPALPYCLAANPPHECVYTLGHYRPGSCVPWRCNYPPWDPWAALTTAGVYTGLAFAIP